MAESCPKNQQHHIPLKYCLYRHMYSIYSYTLIYEPIHIIYIVYREENMFYVLVWSETTDGRLKQLYTLMGIDRARRIAAEVSRTAQLEISFCDRKCHHHHTTIRKRQTMILTQWMLAAVVVVNPVPTSTATANCKKKKYNI